MVKTGLVVVIVLLAAGLAYIRLAPSDPARWHQAPQPRAAGDYPANAGFEARRVVSDPLILTALHRIARATARTSVLAGSPESDMTTYVTRSWIMGYPDYTTALIEPDVNGEMQLVIYGRSRFGSSDMGVNRARVIGWLAALALAAE